MTFLIISNYFIIEAVNYKPKLEYLKSKFNHPNFDEIYIGDKTLDE